MDRTADSPRITHLSWGRLQTEDDVFKDARLYPGGAEAWDWNETGTSHDPGIQPADVEKLLIAARFGLRLSARRLQRLVSALRLAPSLVSNASGLRPSLSALWHAAV
jgi:hypothetical protein